MPPAVFVLNSEHNSGLRNGVFRAWGVQLTLVEGPVGLNDALSIKPLKIAAFAVVAPPVILVAGDGCGVSPIKQQKKTV